MVGNGQGKGSVVFPCRLSTCRNRDRAVGDRRDRDREEWDAHFPHHLPKKYTGMYRQASRCRGHVIEGGQRDLQRGGRHRREGSSPPPSLSGVGEKVGEGVRA